MRKLLLVPLLILALLTLTGCERYSWRQKLTVTVDTPAGEVSGASVSQVSWRKHWIRTDGMGWDYDLTGEAVVVEVTPLSDAESAEVIEAQSVVPDASVRGEIIRWSGGNPLALIESARFYGKSGSASFRGNHMVGSGFAHTLFAAQLRELPADARRHLLL